MDDSGIDLTKGGGWGRGGGGDDCGASSNKGHDPFIDRSKVRILLCDNDLKSAEEALQLLCKCSYQVTLVRSARQVIDALNAEGGDIDIILTEVDLPMKKGMKMLKYITRDNHLQRIPVIMMSAQDEVSIVVKCLRLGAADYLVKPLRTNELLNLWTHMWRRRHMLGLAEKNILSYDFDQAASDPSDANTNSTTIFSDDTDDKSGRSTNPEMALPTYMEVETHNATQAPVVADSSGYRPDVPGISDRRAGKFSSCPKKSELKIGESSAFFSYVKSTKFKSSQGTVILDANVAQSLKVEEKSKTLGKQNNEAVVFENMEAWEKNSQGDEFPSSGSLPDSTSLERSCTPPASVDPRGSKSVDEGVSGVHMHPVNGSLFDVHGFAAHAAYPYYMPGSMNQVMMPSSVEVYQKNLQDVQNHTTSAMLPHYNHAHCPPHVPGMASFPYYPMGMCLQPGQVPAAHQWPSFQSPTTEKPKLDSVDRREAALIKFRQKRKERCFNKKIRYVNRKKLAERRPRLRGQFVRKLNGVTVDLNGEPSSADLEEYEDDEDHTFRDSYPENDAL